MERRFHGFTLVHIPRVENIAVDALAKAAAQGEALLPEVFYQAK